jgi:hypothetical protein
MRVGLQETEGFSLKRDLWVPREINDVLSGRARILDFADPRFGAVIQRYVAGLWVTGTLNGDPNKAVIFERLLNVDEVWVMCFRAPKINQWRLMGRFVAPNEFTALGLYRRGYLNGDKKYHGIAENFVTRWPHAAGGLGIFRGSKIEDYISQPVSDPYV